MTHVPAPLWKMYLQLDGRWLISSASNFPATFSKILVYWDQKSVQWVRILLTAPLADVR